MNENLKQTSDEIEVNCHEEKMVYNYGHQLSPSMSFDSLVVGKANQLAHAAAITITESLGGCYNPLYILSDVGLGKTHLLHAIGNRVVKDDNNANVRYVHSTHFVSDVIRAFQTKQFDEFKRRYTSLDLLLIDDIQCLADKPSTQHELLKIYNSLIESNKQFVISSCIPPNELSGFDPQLRSRFGSGLTVAIEPPTLEMSIGFLMHLFKASNNSVSEELAAFIAEITSSFRELEGAYRRVEAYSRFHARTITIDLVKEALKDRILARCS